MRNLTKKSLKKNLIMNTILTVANLLFPLFTYSHVARVLTPAGTGQVAFVQANLAYFGYLAVLGIPTYGLRECAKVRDQRDELSHTVQELLILCCVSTLISIALLIGAVLIIPQFFQYRLLFFIMGTSILLNTIGMEWLYKALEEYSLLTCLLLIFKVLVLILTFVLIRKPSDVPLYGLMTILAAGATHLCCAFYAPKHISLKRKGAYHFKRHIKPVLMLFATSIIITVYAHFDVSMLGFMRGEYEVGLYNAGLKIKNIVMSTGVATTSVFIPRIAAYGKKDDVEGIQNLVGKSMRISLLFVLPLSIFVFLFSNEVLLFLCGADYLEAANSLRLLIMCIVPQSFANIFGNQLLIPLGMEKRFSQSVLVGLFINLILNLLLIPHFGAAGAIAGTLATECWNAFWMGGGVKKFCVSMFKEIRYLKYAFSVCWATLAAWAAARFLSYPSVFLQLIVAGTTCFAVYYGCLVILKEPILTKLLLQFKNKLIAIRNAK